MWNNRLYLQCIWIAQLLLYGGFVDIVLVSAVDDSEAEILCGCVVCTDNLGKGSVYGTCHSTIRDILNNDVGLTENEGCAQAVHDRPRDCGGCDPITCFRRDHRILQPCNQRKLETSRRRLVSKRQNAPKESFLFPSRTLCALEEGRINGPNTVNGMHNPEPNLNTTIMTDWVNGITGDDPGLYSADFLFSQTDVEAREVMISNVINQWHKGSIINLMWHACPPHLATHCDWNSEGVLRQLEDWEWDGLFSTGCWLNTNLNLMLDEIALHLLTLQDANVELMFRPFHEMNQGDFWWGGRPGLDGSQKLFRYIHDYFINMGLDNLIWVWDMQDFSTLGADLPSYDPGDAYWSVLALDFYEQNPYGLSNNKYDTMRQYVQGTSKYIAIGEIMTLPTTAELDNQNEWSFFMIWPEKTVSKMNQVHSATNVISIYGYTISQTDLPYGIPYPPTTSPTSMSNPSFISPLCFGLYVISVLIWVF